MSKLALLLNKNIKRTFKNRDYEKILAATYLKEWEKQGQKAILKEEFDYIKMSTIFQSIANKQQIENNYLLVRDNLVEFWSTLDYIERRRIVNIDLKDLYEKMPKFFSYELCKDIYITFFDERLNEIYSEETVMFELKQFYELFTSFKTFIKPFSLFNYDCFNGQFVPTKCLINNEDSVVLFNYTLHKFYLLKNDDLIIYPIFDSMVNQIKLGDELLFPLAESLKNGDDEEFFKTAKAFGLYSEEFYKNINKKLSKKHFFF